MRNKCVIIEGMNRETTIQTSVERFLAAMESRRAVMTARSYRNGMRMFTIYLDEIGIETASPLDKLKVDHFIEFADWLGGRKIDGRRYSKKTLGVYMSAVKNYLDHLVIGGAIEPTYSETTRLKLMFREVFKKRESNLIRFPEREDVNKMLRAAYQINEKSPERERNIVLVELLASSGCRVSEITNLNLGQIDKVSRMAIVKGKGSKERRVYFSESAINALIEYCKVRQFLRPSDPVLLRHDRGAGTKVPKRITPTTARNVVKVVASVAGIDPSKFTPHYFRHAFAIKMLKETKNLAMVQDLLGHKDPAATRVYAKIYPEDLQEAHRKAFR